MLKKLFSGRRLGKREQLLIFEKNIPLMRKVLSAFVILLFSAITCFGNNPLSRLQSRFVDLRFGMFVHFNMPTYVDEDWPDPDASPSLFNPEKLDCHHGRGG